MAIRLLLWLLGLSFLEGCSGCSECIGVSHSFEEKILFRPEKKQYHVGDTIWMVSSFDCHDLLNKETNMTEDFCGVSEIGTSMDVYLFEPKYIDSLHKIPTASASNFDFINQIGVVSSPSKNLTLQVSFVSTDSEYGLKIGIILKNTGIYGLFPGDTRSNYVLPGKDRCDTGGFGLTNGNIDNHMTFYRDFLGRQETEYERKHGYCFEVIQ